MVGEGRMKWLVHALLVGVLCAPARAEDRVKAHEAYYLASQHYDLGEYREALDGFKDAYRNYEDPTFLFNIAQCHRQLGDKLQAVRAYRSYLSKQPRAPNHVQVREMIAKLEKQLADEQASRASPPQGTLSPSPQPMPSAAAPPGEPPSSQTPQVEPPPSEPPAVSASPATEAPAAAVLVAAPQPRPSRRPIYKRWWLWTTVAAVVVVGVGVGVGVGLSQSGGTPSAKTDLGTFRF
jgi:hypothetical protein